MPKQDKQNITPKGKKKFDPKLYEKSPRFDLHNTSENEEEMKENETAVIDIELDSNQGEEEKTEKIVESGLPVRRQA